MLSKPSPSQNLSEILKPIAKPCQKLQSLRFRLTKAPITTLDQFQKKLNRPLTLIPYDTWSHLLPANHLFETKFPGDPRPEQTFRAKDVRGRVLVVGPLKEVYHANLESKFTLLDKTSLSEWYSPVNEERRCMVVTPEIFRRIWPKASLKKDNLYRTFKTSWGATHIVRPNDVLIVEEKGAYRIHKDAFALTYRM